MADSKIEWTDATWNPVVGCTRVSPGCDHCYAATMTRRLEAMGQEDYAGLTTKKHFNGVVRTLEHKLDLPLRWKNPRMVFVNSMSDLFHADVPFEFIDKVFCIMNATAWTLPISQRSKRWHVYQVLTKRPDRMAAYMLSRAERFEVGEHPVFKVRGEVMRGHGSELMNAAACLQWPPENVWLGTSCENQAAANERIPHLLRCQAAVRFLSCEPLLGPISLDFRYPLCMTNAYVRHCIQKSLQWVIVGGESGAGARPCDLAWIRSIIVQCKAAGVPIFCKQLGARPYIQGLEIKLPVTIADKKGGCIDEWPEDLRIREFPNVSTTQV